MAITTTPITGATIGDLATAIASAINSGAGPRGTSSTRSFNIDFDGDTFDFKNTKENLKNIMMRYMNMKRHLIYIN